MQPRIQELYQNTVKSDLKEQFQYKNIMMVPRLSKIIVNTSIKEAIQNVKLIDAAVEEITLITGQKAVVTRARKSIANFKMKFKHELKKSQKDARK